MKACDSQCDCKDLYWFLFVRTLVLLTDWISGSAGHSPLSDNGLLGDANGAASSNGGGSRLYRRTEENSIYVQCIMASYALARDPFPRVASLGKKVLRIGGLESAPVVVASRANGGVLSYPRNPPVAALPPTPMPGVMHRSTSWVASSSGQLCGDHILGYHWAFCCSFSILLWHLR